MLACAVVTDILMPACAVATDVSLRACAVAAVGATPTLLGDPGVKWPLGIGVRSSKQRP